MKVDIHQADARGNVLTTLAGTRIVFRGKRLRVPAGFESDGASVPRLFWSTVCPPLDPRAVRAAVLYRADDATDLRKSQDNAEVTVLYKEFFGKPNSHKAHEVLHTSYIKRGL